MKFVLTTCLVLWGLCACTAGDQFTSKNKPEDDRPSEDGETVPGYLTNYDEIDLDIDGTRAIVSAPEGTVVISDSQLVVQVGHPKNSCPFEGDVNVEILGSFVVNADGSFEGEFDISSDEPILLSVGDTGTQVVLNQDGKLISVVNLRDGDGFQPVDIECQEGEIEFDPVEQVAASDSSEGESDSAKKTETEFDLTTEAGCTEAQFFWDPKEERCEENHPLAQLQHCYPTPNGSLLENLIREKEYDHHRDDAEKLEHKLKEGYSIYRCYYSASLSTIQLTLVKDTDRVYKISLPADEFTDDISDP